MNRSTLASRAARWKARRPRRISAAVIPFTTWAAKRSDHKGFFLLQVFAGEAPLNAPKLSLRTNRWSTYLRSVELRLSPYDAAAHSYALQLLYFVCWGMDNQVPESLAPVVERIGGGAAVGRESREPVLEVVVDGLGVPLVGWLPVGAAEREDDVSVSCRTLARQALCRSFAVPHRVSHTLFHRRNFLGHVHLRFHGADASLRSDTLLAVNGWPVVGSSARRRAQALLEQLRVSCTRREWDELSSRYCVLESGMLLVREWFRSAIRPDGAVKWLRCCTDAAATSTCCDYTFLLTLSQCAAVVAMRLHGARLSHDSVGHSAAEQLRQLVAAEGSDSSQPATCARSALKALMGATHARQPESAAYRVLLLWLSAIRNLSASGGAAAAKGWNLLQKHFFSPALEDQCNQEIACRLGKLIHEDITFDDAVQHFCCVATLLSHLQSTATLQGGSRVISSSIPKCVEELTRATVRLTSSLDDVGKSLVAAMHDEPRQEASSPHTYDKSTPDDLCCETSALSFPGAGRAMGRWIDPSGVATGTDTTEADEIDSVSPSPVYRRFPPPFLITAGAERSSCLFQLAASATRLRSAVGALGTPESRDCCIALSHLITAVLWSSFRSFGYLPPPPSSLLSSSSATVSACPLLRRTLWNAVPALLLCAEPRSQTDPQLTLVSLRLRDSTTCEDAGCTSPLLLASVALAMLDWRCFSRQDVYVSASLRDGKTDEDVCRPAASPTGYLPLESVLQPWIDPIDGAASLKLTIRNTAADRLFDHFALLRACRLRRAHVAMDPCVVLVARKGRVLFTITDVQDLVTRMAQFADGGGHVAEGEQAL